MSGRDHPSNHREAKGLNVYTDEYSIYARLPGLGYGHKTGLSWSRRIRLGRGRRRVLRGPRQRLGGLLVAPAILAAAALRHLAGPEGQRSKKLPLYLGFFEFVHNARQRGKALLGSLVEALVA